MKLKKVLCTLTKVAAIFVGATFTVYWFNLDTKLVHKLFPIFDEYYNRLPRDKKL
ncbi:MAG: hypothetical protein RR949_01225 [Oscillospiraceae bacterium]